MGRVADGSCLCGVTLVRVPHPGARGGGKTVLGMDLGLKLMPRKGAGVEWEEEEETEAEGCRRGCNIRLASSQGVTKEAGNAELTILLSACGMSPYHYQVGKGTGLLSPQCVTCYQIAPRGTQDVVFYYVSCWMRQAEAWERNPLGTSWACPTGTRANQHFRDTSCNTDSTSTSKAKLSTFQGDGLAAVHWEEKWLGNVRCQEDPCAIKRKLNGIRDARVQDK